MRGARWEEPCELVSRLIHAGGDERGFAVLTAIDRLPDEARAAVTGILRRVVLPERARDLVKSYLTRAIGGSDGQMTECAGLADLLFLEFLVGDVLTDTSSSLRDAVYFFNNPENFSAIKRLRRVTQRFCGDRAAGCFYVIAENMTKLAAGGRYGAAAELGILLYDHELFDKDTKNSRFGESGVVFEAGKRWHKANIAEVAVPLFDDNVVPYEWALQTTLPCGSLAGADLSPRVRTALLALSDVCLLDLHVFLCGWGGQRDVLSRVIRTSREWRDTSAAYRRFYHSLTRSRRNRRLSSRTVSWIIPDDYDSEPIPPILESCGVQSIESDALGDWLPWVSLSVVSCLRRWRRPLIGALRRAIFKLAADFDPDGNARYPWEPAFKRETGFIPIEALYQYEPSPLTLKGIRTLSALGPTSVDDLRFLHPDSVAAAKRTDEPLLKIYRRLTRN